MFTESEILNLKGLYDRSESLPAHQDYNLFDLEKRHVRSQDYIPEIFKLNEYAEMKSMGHYFLKYTKDSFTRMHTDNDAIVTKTIVTLIETKDLIGGETLLFDKYPLKPRPSNKYAKRTPKDDSYDKDIIPTVVQLQDGQSVIYNHAVNHAVCRVHEGHRIVLISWFKND